MVKYQQIVLINIKFANMYIFSSTVAMEKFIQSPHLRLEKEWKARLQGREQKLPIKTNKEGTTSTLL